MVVVLTGGLLSGLVSFVAGYLTRDPQRDHAKVSPPDDEASADTLPFADEQARIDELRHRRSW